MLAGENGILANSKKTIGKSENAQIEENATLADYENKISGYVYGDRNNTSVAQPTGIRTDAYIKNERKVTTIYTGVTSMTGFTRTTDENNNMSKYLSYSDTDGYTVLKTGWYYIQLYNYIYAAASGGADLHLFFVVNGTSFGRNSAWASSSHGDYGNNAFPFFLTEGNKIYFSADANGTDATERLLTATVHPMF